MFSNTTRRQFIANSALLPIVTRPTLANGVIPTESLKGDELTRLLRRRDELIAECERLDQIWLSAYRQLPSWCKLGPKYLNEHSEPLGPNVGWPAARVNFIQMSPIKVLMRPSPCDLRELFDAETLNL